MPRWIPAPVVSAVTANIVLVPGEFSWNAGYLLAWRDRFASLGKIFFCQDAQLDVANTVTSPSRSVQ